MIANFYLGDDTRGMDVTRFHHDNSIVFRYLPKSDARGITQAAFSVNTHYGFQSGDNLESSDNYMFGISAANRLWFKHNKLALTLRGDYVTNPGLYMAFSPSPISDNDFNDAVSGPDAKDLEITQGTLTFDIMPSDFVTFRIEYDHRSASVPYFAGPAGTTSPDGFIDSDTEGWRPDLKKSEDRVIFVMNFRM